MEENRSTHGSVTDGDRPTEELGSEAASSQHGDVSGSQKTSPEEGHVSNGSERPSGNKDRASNEQTSADIQNDVQVERHSGGGGDTETGSGGGGGDIEAESRKSEEKEEAQSIGASQEDNSATSRDTQAKSSTDALLGDTSSKKSIVMSENREGEESTRASSTHTTTGDELHSKTSLENEQSGFQIVTKILEDLIDKVVQIKEGVEETTSKDGQDSQLGFSKLEKTSILTIKSEDESGSVQMDPKLQAQLALEQEVAALERQKIYQYNISLYHRLITTRANLKHKNAFLLRQMYEHYKRKKIEHLFKDMPIANVDMEGKYVKVLLSYEEAQRIAADEELRISTLVSSLEEKKDAIETDLNLEWNNLINREQDIAKGLLITQTTKNAPDKQTIENLIQRQIVKAKELTKERLIYFKLKDVAAADECHLKSLENLGDNLTLMEYEQLKMQSQSCVEKLEERDADLHRLRGKATSAIQILAEIREKIHILQEDIDASKVVLHDINQQLIQTRERVGYEKKRRDMSRSDTIRLGQEAGLLSDPKLMQDYKDSLTLKESLVGQLHEWKIKFESQKQSVLGLRKALLDLQRRGNKLG